METSLKNVQFHRFLTGDKYHDYIECMIFAKEYAALNRHIILDSIIDFLVSSYGINVEGCFDTVHNYLDWYDESHTSIVIRKGAVSAASGEKLVIPLNMRDGVVIALGKGNEEWNCSAPHGAGRILSRSEARKSISLEEYIDAMDGINTWSVCEETLDEAPQAYKPSEDIIGCIGETVDILEIAKPVYNFKAS
ncbi:MAG: RtcB family protein [Oscillospiraceae bacterium]|nr:RtcB family protein [Oscillospiraceae bacterium]